ncbi:patatin-like phospholipase family protein [Thalassotalea maritima]|uniref:patatin-like phospholipase family protein n=1 Tax=Thalassotalea maritima TaxID=3242416 RepID=UPI0035297C48
MAALQLHAGKTAYEQIQQHGLQQGLFKALIGASGGPKWFVLAGLDRYFCGEFFNNRQSPLYTLGSSAGAWRFACYGQTDPLAAMNRLIDGYASLHYPNNATMKQISIQSERLLADVLGQDGATQIANNPIFENHIVVAKSKGLTRYENKPVQLLGLLHSALSNSIDRRRLSRHYQRLVFSRNPQQVPFNYHDGIDTQLVSLTADNTYQALLATGAIPLLVHGVQDITGAGSGMYRDGGIIDYHFDQPFLAPQTCADRVNELGKPGLVLYPHFYHQFKPGWFDKFLPKRQANPAYFDNVLVLSPTADFVGRLPYQKIPDREDFKHLNDEQRMRYWRQVISLSHELADEFSNLVGRADAHQHVQLMTVPEQSR